MRVLSYAVYSHQHLIEQRFPHLRYHRWNATFALSTTVYTHNSPTNGTFWAIALESSNLIPLPASLSAKLRGKSGFSPWSLEQSSSLHFHHIASSLLIAFTYNGVSSVGDGIRGPVNQSLSSTWNPSLFTAVSNVFECKWKPISNRESHSLSKKKQLWKSWTSDYLGSFI